VKIKAPKEYYSEPDLLKKSGAYIRQYGSNALIIGSPNSFKAAGEALHSTLEAAGIRYTSYHFSGYVTLKKARAIADAYAGVDLIIGVGGGRVLDTAKLVGSYLEVPIVTVPTIAATCAAWAAVSIIYDDEGRFQGGFFNTIGPQLILADTRILFDAPRRYLYAGIVDSLAKWYEIYPYDKVEGASTFLQTMIKVADQLRNILTEKTASAIEKRAHGEIGTEAVQVIDAIIFLAGLTGSLQTDTLYQGIAHPLYNVLSNSPEASHLLHGEKVGYGILLQQVLEGKTPEEIERVIKLFSQFENTLVLSDMGIKEGGEDDLRLISESLWTDYRQSLNRLGYGFSAKEIYDALLETDRRISQSKYYRPFSAAIAR